MTKRQLIGISAKELALSVGVTYEAIAKRVKAGKFSPEAIHEDGSFDEEVARVDFFANTNPNRFPMRAQDIPAPKPKNMKQHAEGAEEKRGEFQVKLERAEVALEKERIELANLKQTHMPAAEAKRALRTFMRTHRDHMLNFANRHGPAMAAELGVPASTFIGLLEARIREAIDDAAASIAVPFTKAPVADEADE